MDQPSFFELLMEFFQRISIVETASTLAAGVVLSAPHVSELRRGDAGATNIPFHCVVATNYHLKSDFPLLHAPWHGQLFSRAETRVPIAMSKKIVVLDKSLGPDLATT